MESLLSNGEMEIRCEPAGLDLGSIAMAALAGLGLVLTVALGAQALFLHATAAERDRQAIRQRPAAVSGLQAEQEDLLRSVRWVDQEAGVVSIPIARAMEMVVAEGGRP